MSPRKGVDESAKLGGTVRDKKRIYDDVANRSLSLFHLTATTQSRVYYQRLPIKIDIPGTIKHSRVYCQHLRVEKSNILGVTKKDVAKWQVLKWSGLLENTLSNS